MHGSSFPSVPFRGRGAAYAGREQGVRAAGKFSGPHALFLLLPMSRPNRLEQALFRVELRMYGLGV